MKIFLKLFLSFFVTITVFSCSEETKLIYPPEDAVNRVTDIHFLKDGRSFIYFNSDMNRKYDFGSVVIMDIDDDNELRFIDSIITPSLGGKMVVSDDEKTLYVTTRDRNGLVRIKLSGKTGEYRLSYIDDTDGDVPDTLKTLKEPYALTFDPDGRHLFVTHLLNGEFSIVDLEKWKLLESHKLKYGVTDIAGDPVSGYYLVTHKSSGNITLVEPVESLSGFNVGIKETSVELPTDGYDVRAIEPSSDGESFYASFQNYLDNSDGDAAPQLIRFKLTGDRYTETELISTLSLKGSMGEIAVFPYTTGSGDNEYNGELVFVASPGEKSVFIVDGGRNEIIETIKYDKCEPYQIKAAALDVTTGYLAVSCFVQDQVLLYTVDIDSKNFLSELGVVK